MPCESYGYDDGPSTKEKLNDVTDKLCWIMSTMKDTSWVRDDIKAWWTQHQKKKRS